MTKYTNATYTQKAKEKWGNRFDYSKINYINSYHKIEVICNKHNNTFMIDPISFIREGHKGNFCDKCKHNKKMSHDEYMEKIKKYADLYDLSEVKFKTTRDSVKLKCPHHGTFYSEARFLSAKGVHIQCPKCSNKERNNPQNIIKERDEAVFYKLKVTHKKSKLIFMKIGITSYTTEQRYMKGYDDFEFELLEEIFDRGENVIKKEKQFKKENINKRFYLPHYINFNGRTECYILDEEMQLKASQIKIIRDGLIEKQKGLCFLCKKDIKMPTLDHFHSKRHNGDGKCRGVLCNSCNRLIGSIENQASRNGIDFSDIPMFLERTVEYIKKIHHPLIHPSEKPKEPKVSKRNYNKLKKAYNEKRKFPPYPKSGKLTNALSDLFKTYKIQPYN